MKRMIQVSGLMALLLVFLAGCINIPIGDGNKLKISKNGIEFTDADGEKTTVELDESGIEVTDAKGDKHSLTLDEENNQINFTGVGEDGDVVWQMGESVDIPENFPADIPFTADAVVMNAYESGAEMSVLYVTQSSPAEVQELFANYLDQNGTNVQKGDQEIGGDVENLGYMLTAEMSYGGIVVSIHAADEEDYEGTVVLIVLGHGV